MNLVLSATAEYKEQLSKTVRAVVNNSTTITLNNTYGVTKGATIRGLGINNSSANVIQSVAADADGSGSDGSIVVQVNQTLSVGTKLYIDDCAKTIVIKPTVKIKGLYPTNNIAIYLQVANFITLGTGS